MVTALFSHADCLDHVNPPGHPEQVARLEAIGAALADAPFDALRRMDAPLAADADILRCHSEEYLNRVRAAAPEDGPEDGIVSLDADTHMSPGSLNAAYRSVGANIAAVDIVLAGEAANAFVACRPPGHHAEKATAMGFCLFGNVSIAAKYALDHHGLARVAVVDFDVHHGNGTQDLLWSEARALFCSTHQMPLYPGSGAVIEAGGHGNIMNQPLAPLSGGAQMRKVYDDAVFPAIEAFRPELILVSAGFDAHMDDPLANLNWSTQDFAWLTARICDVAGACCGGRVVSTLEGGYDLHALAASVAAHVSVLMERGQ
jgi:acetoin utilization deacetylase AcuC-like enzyme